MRLASQTTLRADFPRDPGDLRGEGVQLVNHDVDRVLELEDLAADVDRDLLRQVATGDCGGDLGDVPHLGGEVAGHVVDVVGKVFPDAADASHLCLTAELAFGADFTGDARDFRG